MGTGGSWPAKDMGGDSDMLLLNPNRKWKTPTYFTWDAEAAKRLQGLKRWSQEHVRQKILHSAEPRDHRNPHRNCRDGRHVVTADGPAQAR